MKIGIASDHRGYEIKNEIKERLESKGYELIDYGTYSNTRVNYPEYAFKLCNGVLLNNYDFGIAICGTGIGMSIACNKVKGIRCAKIDNENDAKYAKCHNNANIIAFSANKSVDQLLKLIEIFIENKLDSNEIYQLRNNIISEYENEY